MSQQQKERINKMIETATLEAEKNGVRVMILGLLNQGEELNGYGEMYVRKYPKLKIKIVDGSSLAAQVVVHSIPVGTTEVLFRGHISKVARTTVTSLCQNDIKVNKETVCNSNFYIPERDQNVGQSYDHVGFFSSSTHLLLLHRLLLPPLSFGYSSDQADMILPVSRNLPLNDGLWFEILSLNDSSYKEVVIPRNVYRAVLEVYVSFHEKDEFWYGNLPDDFLSANSLSVPSNGPFREVVVSLDGNVAGAVWPFPVVFTGGINPLLWRPITAIGSFDLPSYDIEMTPFLGSLLDGEAHKLEFSVTNALNVWYIDANLHLWLDQEKDIVEGKVLEISRTSLEVSSGSNFKGLNGNFTTKAKRSVHSIGLVKSSHGDIVTSASQEFTYGNTMVLGKDGNLQIIDQLIQADDRVHAKRESREIYAAKSIKNFPFYLYSDSLKQQNHTSHEVANVTMGFNEERSWSDNGLVKMFKSKVENKQEAQGVMVVKNNLVVSGYGGTQQVYNYVGSDQCYFRNISSFNYTILYDKLETVCKKKALKLSPRLEHLTTQPLLV